MTTEFFADLAERGYEPLLQRATGTVRLDLGTGKRAEHWYLDLAKGHVTVSRRDEPADCVIRTDRATFDRLATGEANAMATMLRNEISFEGNPTLVVLLQKLFPWPPQQEGPQ